ncbi:MAG: hypothetical protein JRN20_16205 [Nitrososphaerota archaeon]|nr:hypothetical protein [Nitrososphaerota archaeon]
MDETRVRRGEVAKLSGVEGDLRVESHARIVASEGNKVVVSGRAYFEGAAEIDSDFECSFLTSKNGMLRANGSIVVHEEIDVEEALYAKGSLLAREIDIGGKIYIGASLSAQSVQVGGSLDVDRELTAEEVEVGGTLRIGGEAKLNDIDVGGKAEIGGGFIGHRVEVGGTFKCTKQLKFDHIETGGTVELGGGEGNRIEVGGKLSSIGDLRCDDLEVGGVVDVEGNLSSRSVEVGGKVRVSQDMSASERLEVGGVVDVGGVLSGADLEVGGNIRASKGIFSRVAKLSGSQTKDGFKAAKIELRKGSKCTGPLVGSEVRIGKRSQVEDVYGQRIVIEDGSRIGNIYAESAEIGDECAIVSLVYTKELRQGERVDYRSPPQKVDALPAFPL